MSMYIYIYIVHGVCVCTVCVCIVRDGARTRGLMIDFVRAFFFPRRRVERGSRARRRIRPDGAQAARVSSGGADDVEVVSHEVGVYNVTSRAPRIAARRDAWRA